MEYKKIYKKGKTNLRKDESTEASSMAADKRIHESTELRIYDNNYGRL